MSAILIVAPSYEAALDGGFLRYRGDPCTCGSDIRHLATRECIRCFPPKPVRVYRPKPRMPKARRLAARLREHYAMTPPLSRKSP